MRFLPCLAFSTAFFVLSQPGFASSQDWQRDLQRNLDAIKSDSVAVTGPVAVSETDATWRAQLPVISLKQSDGTYWQVPSIIMTRAANGNAVGIQLPKTVTKFDAAKTEAGAIVIGQQNLSGTWLPSAGRFQSLQGQLKNIKAGQVQQNVKATIDQMDVSTTDASALTIKVANAAGSSIVDGENYSGSIGNVTYTYDFKAAQGLGIEQILGLLQQNYLAMSKTPVTMTATANTIRFQSAPGVTNTVDSMTAEILVTPRTIGKTVDVKNHMTMRGFSRSPSKVNDVFLPQNAETTGSVSNLPVGLLSFSPSNDIATMKKQMAAAGTRINFDDIRMNTTSGAKMTGTGNLVANEAAPTGFTGRINFKTDDMATVMRSLQQKMNAPGADIASQSQAMMGLMVMQAMGTQNNQTTHYALDLTQNGKVLLNGKDVTGLVNMGMAGSSALTNPLMMFQPQQQPAITSEPLGAPGSEL